METSVGDRGVVASVVTDADTALALGSGSLAVLGTPRLLAWCEAATCRALEGRLPRGSSSVGTAVVLQHLAASAVGEQVTAVAVVRSVDGRRIGFDLEATDAGGTVVARGTVERVVVHDERFLARLARERSYRAGLRAWRV
ncbi:MAG: thioesterase family protein [Ornithinibacter sp.]